jgi:hypothetical protein
MREEIRDKRMKEVSTVDLSIRKTRRRESQLVSGGLWEVGRHVGECEGVLWRCKGKIFSRGRVRLVVCELCRVLCRSGRQVDTLMDSNLYKPPESRGRVPWASALVMAKADDIDRC